MFHVEGGNVDHRIAHSEELSMSPQSESPDPKLSSIAPRQHRPTAPMAITSVDLRQALEDIRDMVDAYGAMLDPHRSLGPQDREKCSKALRNSVDYVLEKLFERLTVV